MSDQTQTGVAHTLVETNKPEDESGLDFDLETAQEASDAAAEVESNAPKGAAKVLADDGPLMRVVWWTIRTVVSFIVPLGLFFALEKNKPFVEAAYHMINPGTNPYPILMKGGLGTFLAAIIAGVPAFTGLYLGSLLSRIKSLKPSLAMAIWCILIALDTVVFVVVARYFELI